MLTVSAHAIVSTAKFAEEEHHQAQDAHAVIVLFPPIDLGLPRSALGAARSKEPRSLRPLNHFAGISSSNVSAVSATTIGLEIVPLLG